MNIHHNGKIDATTRREWERLATSNKEASFKHLLAMVSIRCEYLERLEGRRSILGSVLQSNSLPIGSSGMDKTKASCAICKTWRKDVQGVERRISYLNRRHSWSRRLRAKEIGQAEGVVLELSDGITLCESMPIVKMRICFLNRMNNSKIKPASFTYWLYIFSWGADSLANLRPLIDSQGETLLAHCL